jgi:CRP/FNR family transcriptional regulator, cyclic AMP receptor protein
MEGLERIVCEHPFFAGLDATFGKLVAGCAKNVVFSANEYLFHEGEPADYLYLIRHGRVAQQIAAPGRSTMTFETASEGEIIGLSWLIPPYRWRYDAKALELVRAVALDANCLRGKCEADHDLGYELMKRFVPAMVERLHTTRLQLLDVYGASK